MLSSLETLFQLKPLVIAQKLSKSVIDGASWKKHVDCEMENMQINKHFDGKKILLEYPDPPVALSQHYGEEKAPGRRRLPFFAIIAIFINFPGRRTQSY